jgi:hypothetical protein
MFGRKRRARRRHEEEMTAYVINSALKVREFVDRMPEGSMQETRAVLAQIVEAYGNES